jgi:hypothetical protein
VRAFKEWLKKPRTFHDQRTMGDGIQINLRRAGVSVAAGGGEKMIENDPALIALIDK